jgi:hypothetical protein
MVVRRFAVGDLGGSSRGDVVGVADEAAESGPLRGGGPSRSDGESRSVAPMGAP